VLVDLGVLVGVQVLVSDGVGGMVAVALSAGVIVLVGVFVDVGVGVAVGMGVSVRVGVAEGVSVGVGEGKVATDVVVGAGPHAANDRRLRPMEKPVSSTDLIMLCSNQTANPLAGSGQACAHRSIRS
jgi:hypothetical protein